MANSNIIGHHKQRNFLARMVEMGQLPHALLFSGEDHLGKRTVAFELAKVLHCEASEAKKNPCQECRSCKNIASGIHPDVFLVEPKDKPFGEAQGKQIQISQIRHLERCLSMRSVHGGIKTVVVDNAHQMNTPTQQAFLKTLEEPRGNTVIILITSKPDLLLPTVRSRVQQIKFFPVSPAELEIFLKKQGEVSEDLVLKIVKLSSRRPGMTLSLFADNKKLKDKEKILKDIQVVCRSNLHKRFQWSQNMAKESQIIPEILEFWLRFFRGLMLAKARSQIAASKQFPNYSLDHLRRIIRTIQEVDFAISTSNVNPRLALDVLMLEL